MFMILERFDFRCGMQCFIASWRVVLHGSQDRTFQSIDRCNHVENLPCRCGALRSLIIRQRYIYIAKCNKRGGVVMQCHHHWAQQGEEVQIVSVLKGTLDAPALNYIISLGIVYICYFVWQRLGGDHADGRYGIPNVINGLVVWPAAILTYLPVLPFHIIIS